MGSSQKTLRHARLVNVLRACARANLAPVEAKELHTYVFIANALAPVWDLAPLTDSVLKVTGSPYDPILQRDLDELVGRGVLRLTDVHYQGQQDSIWRVRGKYGNSEFADPVIEYLDSLPDEMNVYAFLLEVFLSIAAIPEAEVGETLAKDATYDDVLVSTDSVLSLYDHAKSNGSSRAAESFTRLMPELTLRPADEIALYIRHLYSLQN